MAKLDRSKQIGHVDNNNATALSTLLEKVDEDSISPSREATTFEVLNALGVDHFDVVGGTAFCGNGRWEDSHQGEGDEGWGSTPHSNNSPKMNS